MVNDGQFSSDRTTGGKRIDTGFRLEHPGSPRIFTEKGPILFGGGKDKEQTPIGQEHTGYQGDLASNDPNTPAGQERIAQILEASTVDFRTLQQATQERRPPDHEEPPAKRPRLIPKDTTSTSQHGASSSSRDKGEEHATVEQIEQSERRYTMGKAPAHDAKGSVVAEKRDIAKIILGAKTRRNALSVRGVISGNIEVVGKLWGMNEDDIGHAISLKEHLSALDRRLKKVKGEITIKGEDTDIINAVEKLKNGLPKMQKALEAVKMEYKAIDKLLADLGGRATHEQEPASTEIKSPVAGPSKPLSFDS